MASILKVDSLLDSYGNAISASNLGLDTNGNVVQVYRHRWGDHTNLASSGIVTATNSTFTFTPKFANSKLIISADLQGNLNGASVTGSPSGRYYIAVNGVAQDPSTGSSEAHENYASGAGSAFDIWYRYHKEVDYTVTSTTPLTISLLMQRYTPAGTAGYFRVNHSTTNMSWSALTVWEIAQ